MSEPSKSKLLLKADKLESPQAFKVEDQASYPGGHPAGPPPHSGLWPNPLTPPPSSTDLQSQVSGSNPSSASAAAASHLSLHARHTDLSVATSSMKGKKNDNSVTFF